MLDNIISADIAAADLEKPQIGAFAQSAQFITHLDETGIGLSLERPGTDGRRKSDDMHFHYMLFSDILRNLARTVWPQPPDDIAYRDALRDSARMLYFALETNPNKALKTRPQRAKGNGHTVNTALKESR